jgi:exosortase
MKSSVQIALRRLQPWHFMLFAAAALLISVLPYAAGYGDLKRSILQELLSRWKDPTWQHGALALPIAAFLLWRCRGAITATASSPSYLSLIGVLFALFLYFIGYRANIFYLGYAGIMLLIVTSAAWLWGWRRAWEGVFPWLMLGFMWPAPFLESSLAFELRFLMIRLTYAVLGLVQVPVIQDGTSLLSAADSVKGTVVGELFSLNIEGACSGMRSLFALMMVGALFSYHRQKSFLQRLFLFSMTFPLAILANMARILVLLCASTLFGQSFAIGSAEQEVSTFHFLTGIVVFLVALAGLQGIAAIMDRFLGKKPAPTVRRTIMENS